jgi:hypothetical protein
MSYKDSASINTREYTNIRQCPRNNRAAAKTEYNKQQPSEDNSYLRSFSNPIDFHVSRHTMILGARIQTVYRKSLTTDRVMRFAGGREGEHDLPVADEQHTLLTLLTFLYITHKSSNHV